MINVLKKQAKKELMLKDLALMNLGLEFDDVYASDKHNKKIWNEMLKIMIEVKRNKMLGIKYTQSCDGVQTIIFLKDL
ncbi:hypothetical protein [Enterococcus sp. AZ179]|uniref:hypothetical protein n=1 Tax=Enterococcus sp. AZ179 TaxID=2774680 RepID=UPI003D278130